MERLSKIICVFGLTIILFAGIVNCDGHDYVGEFADSSIEFSSDETNEHDDYREDYPKESDFEESGELESSNNNAETHKPYPTAPFDSPDDFETQTHFSFPTYSVSFDEAVDICNAWLLCNPDMPDEYTLRWDDEADYAPPPTFYLFGEAYYEIYVCYERSSYYYDSLLVHADSAELLLERRILKKEDLDFDVFTVEAIEDWNRSISAKLPSDCLTVAEALGIYDAWFDEYAVSGNQHNAIRYPVVQTNRLYNLFGVQYYWFEAEEPEKYWYNILVQVETGEILYLQISDGLHPVTGISRIEDFFDY